MATLKYTDSKGQVHYLNPYKIENILVTQEKGQSPADVMSQKAVTDELDKIQSSLDSHKNDEDKKHVPEGGHERQILTWKANGEAQWEDLNNIFTGLEDILAYGVEWKENVADPHLTRIGNMALHKTLPIQSQLKGCIAQVDKVIYWLDENDWRFRKEGKTIAVDLSEYITEVEVLSLGDLNLGVGQYLRNGKNVARITEVRTDESKIIIEWVETEEEADLSQITTLEIGSRLDGYDGTVRVYCPSFYIKSEIKDGTRKVMISTVRIDSTWTYQHEILLDAYRSTVLREVPENMGYLSTLPKNSAISVVNTATYCRGGNNNTSYDQYLETDAIRTQLGKPATSMARSTMRTYSRNAGNEMLSYNQYKNIFYWLWVIEYANFNSQEAFKEELTEEGYHQGGMGDGVTTESSDYWNRYNGYYPLTPCGYLNALGNKTGIKDMVRPAFGVTIAASLLMSNYTANAANGTSTIDAENKVRTFTETKSTTAAILSATWDKISGKVTYKVTGLQEGQALRFEQGSGTSITSFGKLEGVDGGEQTIEVEWPDNMTAREIRADFIGECNFTIQVDSAEAGVVTLPARTFKVPRWRGFDNPFGDIWTNLDGIIINSSSITKNGVKYSEVYTTDDPSLYSDSNWQAMEKAGEEYNAGNGYIKEFDLGTKAEIIPESNGGNTTQYKCDYHWVNSGTGLRTLLVGGRASHGAGAGLGYFDSYNGVSISAAYFGFRSVSSFMSFSDSED